MSTATIPAAARRALHRICATPTCRFVGRHVENCETCFGFGLEDVGGALVPITGAEVTGAEAAGALDFERCPECGGTPRGRLDS